MNIFVPDVWAPSQMHEAVRGGRNLTNKVL